MNNSRRILRILVLGMLLIVVMIPNSYGDEKLGKISGQIINKENSQSLLGATISVQGTALGALTDLDGNFRIHKVPVGTYSLMATSVGFAQVLISEIIVTEGAVTTVNFIMEPKVMEMEGVKVEATVNKNTQAILLHQRRNAAAVSDGISSQEISRAASSDAAEAMTKVTGASVVDGKFVFVRGLGDRYTNTQLNGSSMPSPDPDKQSMPLDLFPSNLFDNIVIEKSFTPDKPGDFAGGSVNLSTKDYPETKSLAFSTSTGTNSQSSYGNQILIQDRGSKDWLGFDDGTREIPQIVEEHPNDALGQKGANFEISEGGLDDSLYLVEYYSQASKAFNPQMTGKKREIPLNQSYAISYGNQHSVFSSPLGMMAGLTYSRKYSSFEGGRRSVFERTTNSPVLSSKYDYSWTSGKEEVLWGGLINLKYGFHPNHKIGWSLTHSRNGESEAQSMYGKWPEFVPVESDARNQILSYTENYVTSNQFSGSHALFENKIRADWNISISRTKQEEPDIRYFTDELTFLTDDSGAIYDTMYTIETNHFSLPKRVWRQIEEEGNDYQLNITIPVSTATRFKYGFSFRSTHRVALERRFEYANKQYYTSFNGDIEAYIESIGDYTVSQRVFNNQIRYRYTYNNLLKEYQIPDNNYSGDREIFATYGMLEIPIYKGLRFVGGVRYEETAMTTQNEQGMILGKGISQEDLLPALNLIYRFGDKINVRTSFSKTLARPSFRERSKVRIEAFNDNDYFAGNPDLQISEIKNYDLRWEWFVNPGEIIAVSLFYKELKRPMEEVILNSVHRETQFQNAEDAINYGFELEFRRYLGFIGKKIRNFRLGGNFTYVESEIKLNSSELSRARFVDPDFPDSRPLWGLSPYMVNVDFGFDGYSTGTSLSIYFNALGRRLKYNSPHAEPDVYEKERRQLDFTASQKLLAGSTLKLAIKNILNEDYQLVYDDLDGEINSSYLKESYPIGVSYSIGVTYQVW